MRYGSVLPVVLVAALAAHTLPAQQLPGLQAFSSGNYDAEARIVASGDIQAPPYTDANTLNRGTGYDGVVSLQINTPNGTYICSGSLLWSGMDILTAAHCPYAGGGATSIIANFFPGPAGNTSQIQISSNSWSVKPGYNPAGSAVQANDLAVIHLPTAAPDFVNRYSLFTGDPFSAAFDVVGFGARGSFGQGATISPSFTARRHGYNMFDFGLDEFFGSQYAGILMADFDNGNPNNDASCFWFGICQTGVPGEANTAGGDSGGPAFINGQIAGVTSFGIRFRDLPDYPGSPPDIDGSLNSSFGEMSGWVRPDAAWIESVTAPEPSTLVLFASGFLVIGIVARRRRAH